MAVTRRSFIRTGVALGLAPAVAAGKSAGLKDLKIGVTDWNLRLSGKPEAVALAAKLGFDGLEISLGRKPERL